MASLEMVPPQTGQSLLLLQEATGSKALLLRCPTPLLFWRQSWAEANVVSYAVRPCQGSSCNILGCPAAAAVPAA